MVLLLSALAFAEPPVVPDAEVRRRRRRADIGRVLFTLGAGTVAAYGHRANGFSPQSTTVTVLLGAGVVTAWAQRPAQLHTVAVDLDPGNVADWQAALNSEAPGARIEAMNTLLFHYGRIEAPALLVTDPHPSVRRETIRALTVWSTDPRGNSDEARVLLGVGFQHEADPELRRAWEQAVRIAY